MSPSNQTAVNLEALGDVVEGIVVVLAALEVANELEIILPGGTDVLKRRCGFFCFVPSAGAP